MDLPQLVNVDEALDGYDGDEVEQREHRKSAPHTHEADCPLPCAPPGSQHLWVRLRVFVVCSWAPVPKGHPQMPGSTVSITFLHGCIDTERHISTRELYNDCHTGCCREAGEEVVYRHLYRPEVAPNNLLGSGCRTDFPGAGVMMLCAAHGLHL